jgi:hypothetical protein
MTELKGFPDEKGTSVIRSYPYVVTLDWRTSCACQRLTVGNFVVTILGHLNVGAGGVIAILAFSPGAL